MLHHSVVLLPADELYHRRRSVRQMYIGDQVVPLDMLVAVDD